MLISTDLLYKAVVSNVLCLEFSLWCLEQEGLAGHPVPQQEDYQQHNEGPQLGQHFLENYQLWAKTEAGVIHSKKSQIQKKPIDSKEDSCNHKCWDKIF